MSALWTCLLVINRKYMEIHGNIWKFMEVYGGLSKTSIEQHFVTQLIRAKIWKMEVFRKKNF